MQRTSKLTERWNLSSEPGAHFRQPGRLCGSSPGGLTTPARGTATTRGPRMTTPPSSSSTLRRLAPPSLEARREWLQ